MQLEVAYGILEVEASPSKDVLKYNKILMHVPWCSKALVLGEVICSYFSFSALTFTI